MLTVGEKIPDMGLQAYHEDEIVNIRLTDQKGKWLVLLFYPADFTFVCPTELEEAANEYVKFQKAGAQIMSVSTDTVFVHKAWHDKSESIKKIKYPMLADPSGELCRRFGTYIEEEGVSLRATYIIDPHGLIKSIELHDNSIGRNIKETLRKLQASKYVSENDGKVCPASWKPGSKDMEPGLDLVGQI